MTFALSEFIAVLVNSVILCNLSFEFHGLCEFPFLLESKRDLDVLHVNYSVFCMTVTANCAEKIMHPTFFSRDKPTWILQIHCHKSWAKSLRQLTVLKWMLGQ